MELDQSSGSYAVKGGKTILGRIFAYQEKTGTPYNEVLELPWITFVLSMLDAPSIDYDSKKKEEKTNTPKTAKEEADALRGLFR